MSKFLDSLGLTHLWEKIHEKFSQKGHTQDFFVMGTQTATTGSWTGTASFLETASDLAHGQSIIYYLPQSGSGNATLNLTAADGTTTGAIACYSNGASRLTTHYPAGNAIRLTYLKNVTISGTTYTGWWASPYYYDNTNHNLMWNAYITAGSAITAKNIVVADANNKYFNLKSGAAFSTKYPILYAVSAISAGSTGSNNYPYYNLEITTTQPASTDTTSWGGTLSTGQVVYIAGSINYDGDTFTPRNTTPLTINPSDTTMKYMKLGVMVSSTQMYLTLDHPLYYYDGVKLILQGLNQSKLCCARNTTNHPPKEFSLTMGDGNGLIQTYNTGSAAFGLAETTYDKISNNSQGSLVFGHAYAGGTIATDSDGSLVYGYADRGHIHSGDASYASKGSCAGGYVIGGLEIYAKGYGSHAEGYAAALGTGTTGGIYAYGHGSHAEGVNTTANNFAEHAQGYNNVSHGTNGAVAWNGTNAYTLFSIGANGNNAIEVMQDGETYLRGIGGYDGIVDPSTCTSLNSVINTLVESGGGGGSTDTVYDDGIKLTTNTTTMTLLDLAVSDQHNANRMAFSNPDGITVEYSTDGGSSWADYGMSDTDKINMVSGVDVWACVGKKNDAAATTSDKLRITIDAYTCGFYTDAKKIFINLSTNGAKNCTCLVESQKVGVSTWSTLKTVSVSGWSGWNSIPLDFRWGYQTSTQTANTAKVRFTFSVGSVTSGYNSNLCIMSMALWGGSVWTYPSNFAKNTHIYTWKSDQSVTFPNSITLESGSVSAPTVTAGTISGSTIYAQGAVSAASVTATDSVSAPSVTATSSVSAPSVTAGTISGSTISVAGSVSAQNGFFQTSDERLKDVKKELDTQECIELIQSCRKVVYTLKDDDKEQVGVIAQDVEKTFPQLINTDENGYKSVDYSKLVVVCMEVINYLLTKIN